MTNERTALLPSDALTLHKQTNDKPSLSGTATTSYSVSSSLSPVHTSRSIKPSSSSLAVSVASVPTKHMPNGISRFVHAEREARAQTHRFLVSKIGHYAVLALVSADVFCIFAEFLVSLYRREKFRCGEFGKPNTAKKLLASRAVPGGLGTVMYQGAVTSLVDSGRERAWGNAQKALGAVGMAFSCLFMVEPLASLWGFGVREFFKSRFHIFDALVILLSFVLDVCLKGILEEVGSIVIVLRLWRVFKIIEELGAGVEEREERWEERWGEEVRALREENEELRRRLQDGGNANDGEV